MAALSNSARRRPSSRVFAWFVTASGVSVGLAAFLIAILVSYDVITRAMLRMSNSWITETTTYLMGYVTFMGAAYALREGSHVNVDLLVQRLGEASSRRVRLLAHLITVAVVICLSWLSFQFLREAWSSGETSGTLMSVPLWIPYLSFFLGMLWLVVVAIVKTVVCGRIARPAADR